MMSAPETKTARLAAVADRLERDFPEDAQFLRSIHLGRKVKRNANGHTAHNLKLADAFEKIQARVEKGEDEAEAKAAVSNEMRIFENVLDDVWQRNRPAVMKILRERGSTRKNIP